MNECCRCDILLLVDKNSCHVLPGGSDARKAKCFSRKAKYFTQEKICEENFVLKAATNL